MNGIPLNNNQSKAKQIESRINQIIGTCCDIDRSKAVEGGNEKAHKREMMQLSKMNAHLSEVIEKYMDQVKLHPANLQEIMMEYV